MSKPMTAFTTDFQHSGMVAKDLDETIAFYTEKLGFEIAGIFHNGENRCAFLRYGHLTIETWEGEPAPMTTGAINHWAFDTPDIEAAFENAKELGLKFKDTEIQHIDSFWEHGIRFFNVYGPNGETIVFFQTVLLFGCLRRGAFPSTATGWERPASLCMCLHTRFSRVCKHILRVCRHTSVLQTSVT